MPESSDTVLVTGAGGFIGGRIVEVLHQLPSYRVRASLRRWSSAARIGRLPLDIVLCDVTDRDQVRSAMEGVDFVVHCATGSRRAKVEGMRNVLEAAKELGVRRVVHFSTIEVYGDADGDIDEEEPLHRTGRDYGDAKIDAEEVCEEYARAGVPVTILRPTLVYGPFSQDWTIEIAERLTTGGSFPSRADAAGICNLVYVDDVVGATLLALHTDVTSGRAFNINGPERLTWGDYLETFQTMMGVSTDAFGGRWTTRLRSAVMTPVRQGAKGLLRHFEEPIMTIYKKSSLARRAMKALESLIRRTPSSGEYRLLDRQAYFTIDRARDELGYEPRFPLDRGMELSRAWLEHHGFTEPVGIPQPR